MRIADCGAFDEVFSHEDPQTKALRHFNATQLGLYAFRKKLEVVELPLEESWVKFVQENRGIEWWKVTRLVEPHLSAPIVVIEFGDGTHLTVDGHHRIVRRWNDGFRDIRAWVIPKGQWEQFLIEDLPQ